MKKSNNDLYYLGIELGSTRIKCSLIDSNGKSVAKGSFNWENKLVNSFWSYDLEDAIKGIGECYLDMKHSFFKEKGITINNLKGIGISAMMHGLIALDENDNLLTPFRTWRNSYTEECASFLSKKVNFNIPARWTISHLYYSILHSEPYLNKVSKVMTLASYIHYRLTGSYVIGKDDASGISPLDENGNFEQKIFDVINEEISRQNLKLNLNEIFPKILEPGTEAGYLSKEGALILDKEGDLKCSIPFCPPEGDAATGMICTNAVKKKTANISVGTSIFGSFVLDKKLKGYHPEIDIVVTPTGSEVAMIHCNNCTSGVNYLVDLTDDLLKKFGINMSKDDIIKTLFIESMKEESSLSKQVLYNYLSGENVTGVSNGAMALAFNSEATMNVNNIVSNVLFSCFVSFSLGMDTLRQENVYIEDIYVHGGLFKTKGVAGPILASILNQKIKINKEAGEGGAWGMSVLALYLSYKNEYSLAEFLDKIVFKNDEFEEDYPNEIIIKRFNEYKKEFVKFLPIERELGKVFEKC